MTRIEKLREALVRRDLDAVVLFSDPAVRWASGFAFTDGAVAVTRECAVLLTDSRYIEAAEAGARPIWLKPVPKIRPKWMQHSRKLKNF